MWSYSIFYLSLMQASQTLKKYHKHIILNSLAISVATKQAIAYPPAGGFCLFALFLQPCLFSPPVFAIRTLTPCGCFIFKRWQKNYVYYSIHKLIYFLPSFKNVLCFCNGYAEALQHHCNKLMRSILIVSYLAIASFYYNDAPTEGRQVF